MKDNDFDKLFRHKMDQLPGVPPEEQDWSDLSNRLGQHERQRRRWIIPIWWPMLALLAGGNLFWWYQWREAMQKVPTQDDRTTLVQTDTVMRKTVVYHYDTVHQYVTTILHEQRVGDVSYAPSGSDLKMSPTPAEAKNIFASVQQDSIAHMAIPASGSTRVAQTSAALIEATDHSKQSENQQITSKNIMQNDVAIAQHLPQTDTSVQSTPTLPAAKTPAVDSIFEQLLASPPPTKKVSHRLFHIAYPRLGLNAGWSSPNIDDKISGSMIGGGIRADVEIAKNVRLGADFSYQQASLKSKETEVLQRVGIEVPEPGGDFSLKYWEIYFMPILTYELHLRYEIPLRGNWKPWLGIGGQSATYLPFDIEFEFENDINNLELHQTATNKSSSGWQGMTAQLGLECRLKPHFYFGTEMNWLHSFSKKPGLLDRKFGLNASLMYAF